MDKDFYFNINSDIIKNARKYNETDFGCLLTSYYKDKKISITLENADKLDSSIIESIDSFESNTNKYYGIHPKFDNDEIIRILSKQDICTRKSLDNYIKERFDWFNIPKSDLATTSALYKKVLLQSLYKFGVECEIDKDFNYESIKKLWKKYENLYLRFNDKNQTIFLLGIVCKESIDLLEKESLYFSVKQDKIVIGREKSTLGEIRNAFNLNTIKLAYGKAYYNGVQPRLLHIMEKQNWFMNDNVITLTLYVQRTTFFTLDAFDMHFQNMNVLLTDTEKRLISKFFFEEDRLQNEVISKIDKVYLCADSDTDNPNNDELNLIDYINHYLHKSHFTNIVNVSTNLVTSDNRLVIARRSNKVHDKNHLYPSVNGTSEFKDMNVTFYQQSVEEDIPTLDFYTNQRMDLNNELRRETIAELNINDFVNRWEYLGITLIANRTYKYNEVNKEEIKFVDIKQRKFHFNVLATNRINDTSEMVIEHAKVAIESFEHHKLYMINVKHYNNSFYLVIKSIWNVIKGLMDYQVLVTVLLGLFSIWILNDSNFELAEVFNIASWKNWSDILKAVTTGLTIIIAVITLVSLLVKAVKRSKYNKKINLIRASYVSNKLGYIDAAEKTLKKINRSEKKETRFNPVTLALYLLYLKRFGSSKGE